MDIWPNNKTAIIMNKRPTTRPTDEEPEKPCCGAAVPTTCIFKRQVNYLVTWNTSILAQKPVNYGAQKQAYSYKYTTGGKRGTPQQRHILHCRGVQQVVSFHCLGEPKYHIVLRCKKGIMELQQCHIDPRTGGYGFSFLFFTFQLQCFILKGGSNSLCVYTFSTITQGFGHLLYVSIFIFCTTQITCPQS